MRRKKTIRKLRASRRLDTLTPREISLESGVGLLTVYDAIHRGELPAAKIGRRRIVSRVNYQAWLAGLGKTAA